MVWKHEKDIKTEKVDKSGRVFGAERIFECNDNVALSETKIYDGTHVTDHQLEQTEKRDRKQNDEMWKSGFRKDRWESNS